MLVFEKNEEVAPYQGAPRAGYSFTYIRPLHAYALFGGANADTDLYLFSITKSTWSCQPTGGSKKPPSRKYHAAAFIQDVSCLLVSGGEDDQGRCLQDFFVLSIKDWKWRKLIVVKCPQPRERHCIFSRSERELILFGGISHYNENTNDIWLMRVHLEREGKVDSIGLECARIQPRGKVVPDGKILAEGTLYSGDRLYAGCFVERSGQLRVFCFEFRQCEWRELQLGLRCTQARMFRAVRAQDDEGFVLAVSDADRRKNSPCKFFYFDASNDDFRSLQDEAILMNNCDEASGEGGEAQILCLRQGKKLFTARYAVLASEQPESSIEDYLKAIKHEQVLSQQLARKNCHLEELYREMQNYITQLHKQYVRFEEDPTVQAERGHHIEDCHTLKRQYAKLDRLYDSASEQVRGIRAELTAINEDFQRCMETEFDEEA